MSDSVRPHRRKPTRLPHPWDSPGKNTGVCCHFLLQCMKVKSEREVTQSCPTLSDPWTAAHQAPPSMGFSRQEYWCGVPLPSLRKHQHLLKNQSVENNTVPLAPQRNWQPWIKREGQEFLKFCPLCSAFSSLLTYNLMLHWSKFSLLQQIYRVTFTVGFYSSNTVQVGEGHFLWLSGLVLCLVPPLSHSKKWSMSH